MEVSNKRKITLTIIGVATLLVMVVSATFAYFAASTSNDKGITNVTASAETVGSIALSNPTGDLHLNLSVTDMAQDNLGVYYATDDDAKSYDETEIQREIAVAELTGGSAEAKYECTTTISVEVSDTMASLLKSGDAYIQFGGLLTDKVDLTNVSSTGYNVTFKLDGTTVKRQSVSAAVAIENRNADQSYLAGSNLKVKFSNSDLNCQVVKELYPNLSETIMALSEEEGSGVYHAIAEATFRSGEYNVIPANEESWTSMTLEEGAFVFREEEGLYGVSVGVGESTTLTFIPRDDGYYYYNGVCDAEQMFIEVNGEEIYFCDSLEEYEEGEKELGYLTSDDEIVLSFGAPTESDFSFSIATAETLYAETYRYEGAEVDNYVTFNNETWRIIGVEEGSTIGLESGKYYTKLISTTFQNVSDDYFVPEPTNFPFADNEMVMAVNWHHVNSEGIGVDMLYESTAIDAYALSKIFFNSTETAKVGILNMVDYALAASQIECSNEFLNNIQTCNDKNWLYSTPEYAYPYTYSAEIEGSEFFTAIYGDYGLYTDLLEGHKGGNYKYRNVIYLDSDVVITNDGTGEEGNKYEIGFKS